MSDLTYSQRSLTCVAPDDYLERNHSLDEFLEAFPSVSREQAVAALEAAHEAVSDDAAFCSMSSFPDNWPRTSSTMPSGRSPWKGGPVLKTAHC